MQFSGTVDSGESTPVSVGSGKFAMDDVSLEGSRSVNETIIGEQEDEEKTLIGYRKEEMNRPRLAEIKWITNDDIIKVYVHQVFTTRFILGGKQKKCP